ncbi:MAG: hypothetical protein NTX79_01940 [Candidatus Micrarchaeota archaeon]|nr:hypothetical protein [Candidatus Micrarchaeota archaeon]
MTFDFALAYTVMGIIGGAYAAVQVAYSLWKKLTKKIEVSYATGHLYFTGERTLVLSGIPIQEGGVALVGENKGYQGNAKIPKRVRDRMQKQAGMKNRLANLRGKLHVGIINNKEESICITDILGTFKYDRKKHKEAGLDKYGKPTCFTLRPASRKPSLPINLQPHEAIDLECVFDLKEVYLGGLERNMPIANLPIYFNDGVPIVIFNEKKIEEHWFSNPVSVQLSIHVNGKDLIYYGGSLSYRPADEKQREEGLEIDDKADDDGNYGTIDGMKILEIEQKFCK